MTSIKRFLLLALITVLGIFAFQNQTFLGESGHIRFFKFDLTLIMGFWLTLSFLSGALLFLIIDLPRTITLKRDLRRKSQDLARLQAEISHLQVQNVGLSSQPNTAPNSDSESRSRT